MKIGIIGAGMIGATTASLFAEAGFEVAISNSRGPESLQELVQSMKGTVHAMTVEGAANFGEIILLAVPWRSPQALPKPETVAGKIVIDAMNPYREGGGLYDLGDSTSSEETQKLLPNTRLVKAFNTIYFKHLQTQGDKALPIEKRRAIFIAGDDVEAKQTVSRVIESIGFAAVDTGSLRVGGKRQEPNSSIYNRSMTVEEAVHFLKTNG